MAFLRTLPGLAKQLCMHGEKALKPQKVKQNWRGAEKGRKIGGVRRKEDILSVTHAGFDPLKGPVITSSFIKCMGINR